MKLNLSTSQLSKLKRGQNVQIQPHQFGSGIDFSHLNNAVLSKLEKAHKLNKGVRFSISEQEGEGIFGKRADRMLKKAGVKKLAYKMGDAVKPLVKEAIQKGVKRLKHPVGDVFGNVMEDYIDNPESYGQGVFGKRFDRLLKRGGVKKLAYKAGDAIKPLVHKAIETGVQSLSVANPALAPASMILGSMASDYIDNPKKYGQGVRSAKRNKYLPTELLKTEGGSIRSSSRVYKDQKNILRPDQPGFSDATSKIVRPNGLSYMTGKGCGSCGCSCGKGFKVGSGFKVGN